MLAGSMESQQPTAALTQILKDIAAGDRRDLDRLLAVVYDELRGLALGFMQHERVGRNPI